ncbi:MAG: OprO/OprP family phosphate-selective porin [Desulfocapsa sp.]|nr:OprO/OprP family phosphate-selective porin [Desulfocapsa sp.]
MKKMYSLFAVGSCCAILAMGAIVPNEAEAGPLVEFGDDGGYMQFDVKFQGIMENTDFGSGKNGQEDRTDLYLRRARIVFTGMINETWGAKFQTCAGTSASHNFGTGGYTLANSNDKNNSRIRLTDGYLIGLLGDTFNIKLGLTKIPLTRANLDACFAPLTSERSAFVYTPYGTDATKNSRDMGLMATGNFFDDSLKYWAAIMEGREGSTTFYNPFVDQTFTSTPEPESNLEYIFRLHYSVLDPENRPTAMGYKGTYLGRKGKILTLGAAFAYEKDAAYKNTMPAGAMGTPDFLSSKVIGDETVDYLALTADIFFEYPFDNGGVITATALYLDVDLDDAYKTSRAVTDRNTIVGGLVGQRDGWYVKAGYLMPFTVGEDGLLQAFGRYEQWDYGFMFNVEDQTIDQYGAGINYFPLGNEKVRFTFEYYRTDFEKSTRLGDYLNMTGVNTEMYDNYGTATLMFMVQL